MQLKPCRRGRRLCRPIWDVANSPKSFEKSCNLPGQKEAKSVYAHTTAAVLRAKDCVMQAVTAVRKGADDVYADAKAINDRRAAEAEPETIEDTAAEAE